MKMKKTQKKIDAFYSKTIFALFCFLFLTLNACAKSNYKKNDANEAQSLNETRKLSPEEERLNRALFKLSDKCKAVIPNGSPEEFLQDLDKVLRSENDFSQEDLSPFYLIDKKHSVSQNYVPKNLIPLKNGEAFALNKNNLSLRPEAYDALKKMAEAAKKDGITLVVSSTYRSYEYQKNLFDYWVSVDGLEEAERESARPGTSQHQLGMAIDFAPVDDEFDKTAAGKWVYENAANYGWSLSFPKGYEDVTGYRWECWHFRYIGKEAVEFQKKWFGNVQQFMIEFLDAWKNEKK